MLSAFRFEGGDRLSNAKGTVKEEETEIRNGKGMRFVWIRPTRKSPNEARASHSGFAKTSSPRYRATGGEVSESVSESESDDMMEA